MKQKDVIALMLAVVIFLVAGYIAYTQLFPKKSGVQQGNKVEIVGEIKADFDSQALSVLNDSTKTHDFAVPFDLSNGLNNQAVFGQ